MNYSELRKYLGNTEKYPGCKKYGRAPLIHRGFPGTFNLSFTEYDMFREFGGYSNFSRDQIFSTIQSCIRPQDILENIKNGKNLWKYLGVFEMSDIAGQITLSKKEDTKEIHTYQLKRMIEIFTDLGLKKDRIFPSYQKGGKVSVITKGKYNFDFYVPEDTLMKEAFIKEGIPAENLIPDETRDTLLSLHINMPTPWGYRNEINYNIGTKDEPKLLDIGTLEYFLWLPTYSSEEKVSRNIDGLEDFRHTISIGAIGVERVCVAINSLKTVFDVDYIKKFYDEFRIQYPDVSEEQRMKSGEVIRALHRIFSDVTSFNLHIGRSHNTKIRAFLNLMRENFGTFDKGKLKKLLVIHAESQPWQKNLYGGIKPTLKRINQYYSADKHGRIKISNFWNLFKINFFGD